MIEPLRIDSSRLYDGISDAGGHNIFYIYGNRSPGIGLASTTHLSLGERPISYHWAINLWGPPINNVDYCIDNRVDVTRENFVNHLMSNYPDHFEWLLFHPEFLL